MADFTYAGTLEGHEAITEVKDVVAGTTASIAIGDLVVPDNSNPGYVRKVANGEASTNGIRVYLAVSASTETASANGTVTLLYARGMRLQGKVTTVGNLAQALIDTKVTFDVSGGTITVDENDTTNGIARIERPAGGAGNFDSTNGVITVIVNESTNS